MRYRFFSFLVHADDLHGVSGLAGEGLKLRSKRLMRGLCGGGLLFFLLPGKLFREFAFLLPAMLDPVCRVLVFFKKPAVFSETVVLLQKLLCQLSRMQRIVTAADDARRRQKRVLIAQKPGAYGLV